jgi:hypothetical protein
VERIGQKPIQRFYEIMQTTEAAARAFRKDMDGCASE